MPTPTLFDAILNGPALAAPPGVPHQFDNPPSMTTESDIILAIFLGLSILACFMRIYTKWVLLRDVAREDYALILGTILITVYTGLAFKDGALGVGVHQWDLRIKTIEEMLYFVYISEIIYCFGLIPIKVSILLQYIRIFRQTRKWNFMYIGSWSMIWLTVLFHTALAFLTFFACKPRRKFWNPFLSGTCMDSEKVQLAGSYFNVTTDFLLLLLPQREIWKLQITQRKKLAISAVFFVALCACITSVVRLYYTVKAGQTSDVSYILAKQGMAAQAEMSIGILCCCLPVLPRYYQVVMGPRIDSFITLWTKNSSNSSNLSSKARKYPSAGVGSKSSATRVDSQSLPMQGTYGTLEEENELRDEEEHELGDLRDFRKEESKYNNLRVRDCEIRLTHDVSIESRSAHSGDLDTEAQRRAGPTHREW